MNLKRKIERNILKKTKKVDRKNESFSNVWKGWKEWKKQNNKE